MVAGLDRPDADGQRLHADDPFELDDRRRDDEDARPVHGAIIGAPHPASRERGLVPSAR